MQTIRTGEYRTWTLADSRGEYDKVTVTYPVTLSRDADGWYVVKSETHDGIEYAEFETLAEATTHFERCCNG